MVKTTTRQTIFLPVIGLVEAEDLTPQDLIGVNKDSYLVLDKLPPEYDSRVKAMEVDLRTTTLLMSSLYCLLGQSINTRGSHLCFSLCHAAREEVPVDVGNQCRTIDNSAEVQDYLPLHHKF